MNIIGSIPGPYGKPVDVYCHDDETDPEAFHHDIAGCMDIAGIHDPRQRKECEAAFSAQTKAGRSAVPFQIFLDHGGRTVPKKAIVKPSKPATLDIPRDYTIQTVAGNWATLALDHPEWASRADALLDVIDGGTKEARSWTMATHDGFEVVHSLSLSILVTSAIEHLTETEIDCLEQAAFYAMATHDEWSKAGVEWLKPFRKTWFRDWALARPRWQAFASGMRKVNRDLPVWIVRGTSA